MNANEFRELLSDLDACLSGLDWIDVVFLIVWTVALVVIMCAIVWAIRELRGQK